MVFLANLITLISAAAVRGQFSNLDDGESRRPAFAGRLRLPDRGTEIVAAMKRARATADGVVRWTETCYCATPLQRERATVLDRYFTWD